MKLFGIVLILLLGCTRTLAQSPLMECAHTYALDITDKYESYEAIKNFVEAYILEGDTVAAMEVFEECLAFCKLQGSAELKRFSCRLLYLYQDIAPERCVREYKEIPTRFEFQLPLNEETLDLALRQRLQAFYRYDHRYDWAPEYDDIDESRRTFCNVNWTLIQLIRNDFQKSKRTVEDYDRYMHFIKMFTDTTYSYPVGTTRRCIDLTEHRIYGLVSINDLTSAIQLIDSTNFEYTSDNLHIIVNRNVDDLDMNQLGTLLQLLGGTYYNGHVLTAAIDRLEEEQLDFTAMKPVIENFASILLKRKDPKTSYDLYQLEVKKMSMVSGYLLWDGVDEALKMTKTITDREKKGTCFLRIGKWYQENDQTAEAIKYYDKALKEARKDEVHQYNIQFLGDIAKMYYHIGEKEQSFTILNEAVEKSKEITPVHVKYALRDISAGYVELGWYEEAMQTASKIGNDGSGANRSKSEEDVYQTVFLHGDTLAGIGFLERATAEVYNIEHPAERQWYRRQAALAFAEVGDYERALEVANELEKYGSEFVLEFIEGFIQTYETREGQHLDRAYFDSLMLLVESPKFTSKEKSLNFLIDYFFDNYPEGDVAEFESNILAMYKTCRNPNTTHLPYIYSVDQAMKKRHERRYRIAIIHLRVQSSSLNCIKT